MFTKNYMPDFYHNS